MKKSTSKLTSGEYPITDGREGGNEVASARWEFIEAVNETLPDFSKHLQRDVYPKYARLAGKKDDYYMAGWKFSTWQLHSDPKKQLTPSLLAWARAFNLADVAWVLEGALATLRLWHKFPDWRNSLDIQGFRPYAGGHILTWDNERRFRFDDPGWDPQRFSWPEYRANVQPRFETALRHYAQRIRALIKGRGGQPGTSRYSVEHFQWLARYQCGGWSLDQILKGSPLAGDKTTISKGLHRAAKLADFNVRAKRLKVRAQRSKLNSP